MRPTRRPKTLKVRVTPEVYRTITRLSELQNVSFSQCVADMLETLHPGLLQTLAMMEESRKLDASAKNNLVRALERHEQHLADTVGYVSESINAELENAAKQLKLPF